MYFAEYCVGLVLSCKRDRNDGRENWQESREKEIIIDLGKPQASGSMGQEEQPYLENHRHVVMMDIIRLDI